ncbi:MAG TPA: tetratricopeptide repeat protein [Steroidobacteraceae bacterium]|nr:tetratricopeptide repeat protein [Steroidobacteraceae bacterium]
MAEGLLGGILGDGDEKPDVEASDALAGAEAFASAVAAKLAGNDPEVARKTAEFLSKQSQLLDTQNEQLKDEHPARLHFLQGQAREVDIRRFGLRLRVGFQLFLVLVATGIGAGVVLMVRDAVTSRQVVIEPFRIPSTLAAHGTDGAIVASGLLDELGRLQDATRSTSAARGLTGAWSGNIKLDVPETGISLGEISRLLRERFGHDVRIDGDLVGTPAGGLSLTVRGNGVPPKTFEGSAADLRKLTVAAAEYVYSKSQPARWASYLNTHGRYEESIAFCKNAVGSAEPADRATLLTRWAVAIENSGGSARESLGLERAAVKLQPDNWIAHNNVQNDLMVLADEEAAWKAGDEMRKVAGGRPGRAPESYYQNWDYLTWNLKPWLESTVADAEANAGAGSGVISAGPNIADIELRLHDPEAADLALKTAMEDPDDLPGNALTHHVRGRVAMESGDFATAVVELDAYGVAFANPAVSTQNPGYQCWIALAEEAAGHPDKADTLLKSAGTFVDCYRFRADILDGRGNWPGAQKAYAEAVAVAPDLPAAYYSWGVALARHGDLVGAETKLNDANKRGPHWADPLKAWGDVLLKQGNTKQALAKYDEALRYAPNWKQLKEAREAAAKQKL